MIRSSAAGDNVSSISLDSEGALGAVARVHVQDDLQLHRACIELVVPIPLEARQRANRGRRLGAEYGDDATTPRTIASTPVIVFMS